MRAQASSSSPALVASFVAVAVAFVVATVVAQVGTFRVRAAAAELTGTLTPGVRSLSALRGRARRLELAIGDAVAACRERPCRAPAEELDALRRGLLGEWAFYRTLEPLPGERQLWPDLDRALQVVDAGVTGLPGTLAGGDPASVAMLTGQTFRPAFNAVDRAAADLLLYDQQAGVAIAARIDALARWTLVVSAVLDLVSLLLTGLAAVLVIRFVRRNEARLVDRAEELDRFAGRVAHDVLGPLTATNAALRVARKAPDERRGVALDRIQRSVDHVEQLVRGLLAFARSAVRPATAGGASPGAVIASVLEQLQPQADAAQVELGAELAGGAAVVACERAVLGTVVWNLVGNAIKHMGQDRGARRVVVRTRHLPQQRAWRIEVEDTGPGIAPELRDHLFEPFVRGAATEAPGFGLGLATVKRIVDAHGGRIGFSSPVGGGTLFWLELPAGEEAAAAAPAARRGATGARA